MKGGSSEKRSLLCQSGELRHRLGRASSDLGAFDSWTDKQRDTLKSPTFAQETGLRVIRVVNRPTAACIAYNLHQQPVPDLGEGDEGFEGRLVLVVDVLGQLDDALELEVTLLEIEDGVFEILASAQGREAELREVMDGVLKQANMTPSRVNHVL